MQTSPKQTLSELQAELNRLFTLSAADFGTAASNMYTYALNINNTFGQGRQRMTELMNAVSDAVPAINRLGGSIENVQTTIQDIALASRRNVIANTESVEKLYAATQVLGEDAQYLTNAFLDVGIGIQNIPDQLEKSLEYVRSIGGNSQQVMREVTRNMDQMNRYQFEGGVQGLTKMAAQATMLRFNMNETFRLAEKVLDPEGAVEVAAAFQRLGVAAGNLVDPFQLMNLSINDPSGLQTSLAEVSKQFTYFDEKTKSFKINPQGVLTLKEIEKQTGVSAAELSKMGLAAAELDQRLSAVSAAGLKIASEEDKQFLANIAQMGKGGEYEVKITDEEGKETTKKLSEITQTQFDNLIKEQREGPKSLEDLARNQLGITKQLESDVRAIKDKIVFGVVSAPQVTGAIQGVQRVSSVVGGEFSRLGTTADVRKETGEVIKSFETFFKDLKKGDAEGSLKGLMERIGTQFEDVNKKFGESFNEAIKKIASKTSTKTGLEREMKDLLNYFTSLGGKTTTGEVKPTGTKEGIKLAEGTRGLETGLIGSKDYFGNRPISDIIGNINIETKAQEIAATTRSVTTTNQKTEVVFGDINIKISLPDNFNQLNTEQQQKVLNEVFNSQKFREYVLDLSTPNNPTKSPTGKNFQK